MDRLRLMKTQKILTQSDVPLLLLGYNRIDFLRKRILEISKMPIKILYLSIDGGGDVSTEELKNFVSWSKKQFTTLETFVVELKTENLGLVNHITAAISRVLSQHSHVVIVEDDIELGNGFFENIIHGFNQQLQNQTIGIVGGMSVLNLPARRFVKNRWRDSNYISIWGWGCSLEVWKNYEKKLNYKTCLLELNNSKSWSKLTNFQKSVWLGRFGKVISNPSRTWDIQLQYLSFVEDYKNIYPIFSFVRNEGFNDSRSSNTKDIKPFWMTNNPPYDSYITNPSSSKLINFAMRILDSNLLAGDTKLIFYWKHKFKLRLPFRH